MSVKHINSREDWDHTLCGLDYKSLTDNFKSNWWGDTTCVECAKIAYVRSNTSNADIIFQQGHFSEEKTKIAQNYKNLSFNKDISSLLNEEVNGEKK